jgi:hypothetical protein
MSPCLEHLVVGRDYWVSATIDKHDHNDGNREIRIVEGLEQREWAVGTRRSVQRRIADPAARCNLSNVYRGPLPQRTVSRCATPET